MWGAFESVFKRNMLRRQLQQPICFFSGGLTGSWTFKANGLALMSMCLMLLLSCLCPVRCSCSCQACCNCCRRSSSHSHSTRELSQPARRLCLLHINLSHRQSPNIISASEGPTKKPCLHILQRISHIYLPTFVSFIHKCLDTTAFATSQ